MRYGQTPEDLRLQQAWRDFIEAQQFQLFVTLNFNCTTTIATATKRLKDLLAHIDSAFLGRNWSMLGTRRTLAFAFIENVESNLHIHIVLKLPQGREVSVGRLRKIAECYWAKRIPSGTVDIRPVTDLEGLARYVTKQMRRVNAMTDGRIIISSDFHSQT